jgi:serine/threonine protein kinase
MAAYQGLVERVLGAVEREGDFVGPYQLIEGLGEGGFGVVWKAQERKGVRGGEVDRLVALKIVKPGMDTSAVLARFEHEQRTLALLHHPSIAGIYRAGATDRGRPYFAMQYVSGRPITDFCDSKCMTVRGRLLLFAKACEAVTYAHTRSIIHRDLSPGNILVSDQGGEPHPTIIDFGLCKALGAPVTAHSLAERRGMRIGTLEYMPPEQAGGNPDDLDVRADVYSLGSVLYELLVGAAPFEKGELRRAEESAALRRIREEPRARPSSRLARLTVDQVRTVARCRQSEFKALRRQLRRELEWIPDMAVRLDRERRYQSVEALARDARNYLEHKPLHAGPESWWYLGEKLLRRRWREFAAAAIVLLAALSGAAATVRGYTKEAAARQEREGAKAVSQFFYSAMEAPGPWGAGPDAKVIDVVDAGAPLIESTERPVPVQIELHRTYAHVYYSLTAYPRACREIERALALSSGLPEDKPLRAELLMDHALYLTQVGDYERVGRINEELKGLAGYVKGDRAASVPAGMATHAHDTGDYSVAEWRYRQALEASKGTAESDVAEIEVNMGRLLLDRARPELASPFVASALRRVERLDPAASPYVGFVLLTAAYEREWKADWAGALALYRRARDSYLTAYRGDDRLALSNMARMVIQGLIEDHPELQPTAGESDLRFAPEAVDLGGMARLPVIQLRNRARLLYRQGRAGDGDALFDRALLQEDHVPEDSPGSSALSRAHTLRVWTGCLVDAGRSDEAYERLLRAEQLASRLAFAPEVEADTRLLRARVLLGQGKKAEALQAAQEGVAMRRARFAGTPPEGEALMVRARALTAAGNAPDAAADARRAAEIFSGHLRNDDPRLDECRTIERAAAR